MPLPITILSLLPKLSHRNNFRQIHQIKNSCDSIKGRVQDDRNWMIQLINSIGIHYGQYADKLHLSVVKDKFTYDDPLSYPHPGLLLI